MLAITKLFAPFMPHITEELYQGYFREHDGAPSVHVSAWPAAHEDWIDEKVEAAGDAIIQILGGVRKYRSEKQLSMKAPLQLLTIYCPDALRQAIEEGIGDLQAASNVEKIVWERAEKLSWDVR